MKHTTPEGAGRNDHIHGDESLTRELGQYECDCGADYARDVAREGYPKWHAPHGKPLHFVDDCSEPGCDKRLCHACCVTCKICGNRYCPDHTTEDLKAFGLCEDCLGDYTEIPAGPERDKLIEVEARLKQSRPGYYNAHGERGDLEKVLEIAKGALVRAAENFGISTTMFADHKEDGGCIEVVVNPVTRRAVLLCNECDTEMARGTVRDSPAHTLPKSAIAFFNALEK